MEKRKKEILIPILLFIFINVASLFLYYTQHKLEISHAISTLLWIFVVPGISYYFGLKKGWSPTVYYKIIGFMYLTSIGLEIWGQIIDGPAASSLRNQFFSFAVFYSVAALITLATYFCRAKTIKSIEQSRHESP